MRAWISRIITDFVAEYQNKPDIHTVWGEPVVGFADGAHPYILSLKTIVGTSHSLPRDVLEDASIVIAYFIPLTKELADTNKAEGNTASPEWARAYEETNAMIGELNQYLIEQLQKKGIRAALSPESFTFDQKRLKSNWSHRHFAYAAGLGTFGVNNMLITRKGCCGRFGTIVTNMNTEPDSPMEEVQCLYRKDGTCGVCVKHCPSGALTLEGYDRQKCYQVCRHNAEIYTQFGSSYTNETGNAPNSVGSEVCGKCVVNIPCAFIKN